MIPFSMLNYDAILEQSLMILKCLVLSTCNHGVDTRHQIDTRYTR